MDVSLVMFKSDGTRREFPLSKDTVIVGRKNDCDLRIPLTSVSRKHCEIKVAGEDVTLRDLGSSNGTYHNSIRVQEAALSAGDEVVIGPVVFTVVVDGEPSDIKPVRTIVGGAEEAPPGSGVPEALDEMDLDMPTDIEPEQATPTVDLDDPIAALAAIDDESEGDDADADAEGDDGLDDPLDSDSDDDEPAAALASLGDGEGGDDDDEDEDDEDEDEDEDDELAVFFDDDDEDDDLVLLDDDDDKD